MAKSLSRGDAGTRPQAALTIINDPSPIQRPGFTDSRSFSTTCPSFRTRALSSHFKHQTSNFTLPVPFRNPKSALRNQIPLLRLTHCQTDTYGESLRKST